MSEEKTLDMKTEAVPEFPVFEQWSALKKPIPRPILAVVQAHVKLVLKHALTNSKLLQDPFLQSYYEGYFPTQVVKKYPSFIQKHRLKAEIIRTVILNRVLNQAGMTFYFELGQITGKSIEEITKAYLIADQVLNGNDQRTQILDSSVPESSKYEALLILEEAIKMLSVDLLQLPGSELSFKLIEKLSPIVSTVKAKSMKNAKSNTWELKGFSEKLGKSIQSYSVLANGFEIFLLSENEKISTDHSLSCIQIIDSLLQLGDVRNVILELPAQMPWEVAHHYLMLQDLRSAKFSLIKLALRKVGKLSNPSEKQIEDALKEAATPVLPTYLQTLKQLKGSPNGSVSLITVLLNRLKS